MIKLISTGGTIAKRYDELSGELVFDKEHIEKMLAQGRCNAHIKIKPLMLKDSLDLTETEREIIFKACLDASESKIIITHGTDTMVESAKKLSTISNKTIILTGAMIPYAFKNSDSLFNLSFALASAQMQSSGVYICMNGQIFSWDNVVKNRAKGVFEKLN